MGAIDNIKEAIKLVQQIDNIELYRTILNVQADLLGMQDKIRTLTEENNQLKDKLIIKYLLIFKNNMYWISNNGTENGPYCSKCWDEKEKLIHLHSRDKDFIFPSCHTYIDTDPNDSNCEIEDVYGWNPYAESLWALF